MLLEICTLQLLACLLNIEGAIATTGQEKDQAGCYSKDVILNCLVFDENKSNLTSLSIHWRVNNKTSHSYETVASMRNGETRIFKNGTALEGRLAVLSNGSLKISSLRPDDETSYKCLVSGGRGGPYEKIINLQINCYENIKTNQGRVTMSTVKPLKVTGIFMESTTPVAPLVDADSELPLTQNNSVCGEVLIDPIGGFQSPNFPSTYPENSRCQWNISVEPEFAAVDITFDRFDLEHEDDCRHDHIIIYDELGNQIGCRRCGTYKSPVKVQIRGRKVVIVFHSNDSVNKSGFRANYKGALSVGNISP